MAKNKQYAAQAEAEARGGSSSQDEGEEESESASESECEEKEVENEEQEQDEGEEGSSSESESECEEKEVEKEEQDEDQDEGEEGSASESESECEEKEDKNTIPAPLPKKPSSGSAAQHPQSSSSSSSESDSSPVNHCGVDPNMKMMQSSAAAAASASASAKNKKPTSKKPICNPTLKRLLVESESENRKSKRAKAVKGKVNVNADGVDRLNKTSASKKVYFQRLWSAEDEIVILQGIIKYTADTGSDPSANINAFYLSIKNFIHVHVTKTQLCDKVRKLKQKYMTNTTKAKWPSNSHDQQLYNLSQKIWGFQTNAVKLDTTNNNKDVVHGKPTLKEEVSNKMAEIARELKKLQSSQLELLRSTQLICEQTKRVLESLQ